jgi:hypothetical protein
VSLHDATRKQKEDWPGAAAYIATRTAAAEPIAIPGESSSNANGLLYYWSGLPDDQRRLVFLQSDLPASPLPIVPIDSGSEIADLSEVARGGQGFWLGEASFIPPPNRQKSSALSLRLQCVGSAGLQRRAGRPRHGVPPLMADQDRRPRGANVLRCGPPGRA